MRVLETPGRVHLQPDASSRALTEESWRYLDPGRGPPPPSRPPNAIAPTVALPTAAARLSDELFHLWHEKPRKSDATSKLRRPCRRDNFLHTSLSLSALTAVLRLSNRTRRLPSRRST